MPTPEMYMPVNINSKQKSLQNRKLGLISSNSSQSVSQIYMLVR